MARVLKNSTAFGACEKLYLNEEFADVHFVFVVDGYNQKVPANKANLAVVSPVFRAMFFGSLPEKGDVKIVDADINAFKQFLQFFYLGEVTVAMENMETVARLADKYDILEHVNACADLFESQLTSDNVCWAYQLAVNLNNEKLIKCCEENIIKSSNQVFASDVFKRCDRSILKRILTLRLKCNEVDVFDACLTWAKHACEQNDSNANDAANLRVELGDVLKLIRFGSMTNDEFLMRYVPLKGLFTSDEFEDIMLTISVNGYKPKIFDQIPRRKLGTVYSMWNCLCQRNRLSCIRSERRLITIRNPEVTSFSSNGYLMLKGIRTAIIHSGRFESIESKVDVTIIKRDDLTFRSNQAPKILYQKTSTIIENQLILPKPILVEPNFLYEVCLGSRLTRCSYHSDYQSTVDMGDRIRIQFHRNPTLDYDNSANGWISALIIDQI